MAATIQEIGIPIDLSSGTFQDTEFKDGKLQLAEDGVDDLGQIVYKSNGHWISSNVPIKDKIKSFKNVVKSMQATQGASQITSVAVSDDGYVWGEYIPVGVDGEILNEYKQYARVKIELFASLNDSEIAVDVSNISNEYTKVENGKLSLKKDYIINSNEDSPSSDIFRTNLDKSLFYKINTINMNELSSSFIYSDGNYKKLDAVSNNWITVSSTMPSASTFISDGMPDLSVLDRVNKTVVSSMDGNGVSGQVLGEGKVFKSTVDMKKFLDIKNIKID